MFVMYAIMWIFILASAGCTVAALGWAISAGQMRNMHAAALSIFDEDERPNKNGGRRSTNDDANF